LNCPNCGSDKINLKGLRLGKQRYLCKECGKWFTQKEIKEKPNSLLVKISERYSDDELRAIANGQGTTNVRSAFPVTFSGDIFKFMFITDTHEGSQWVRDEWLESCL